MSWDGWAVVLNGVAAVDGCNDSQETWDGTDCFPLTVLDILTDTPDGLDLPDLRTEDVTYFQRDGVRHFSDWYTPRTVTIQGTIGPVDPCTCTATETIGFGEGGFGEGPFGGSTTDVLCSCLTVRQQLSLMVQAWKRGCCDTEIVVHPPCPADIVDPADRIFTGPFGVVGRPRQFKYKWNRNHDAVDFVARFDAVDQRMYILDACGTPGYTVCTTIDPGAQILALCPDEDGNFCPTPDGWCFTEPVSSPPSVDPEPVSVGGTERVYPTITLYGPLSDPRVENVTTTDFVTFNGSIGDSPVTINTEDGTAFDSEGNSLTHLLGGSLFLSMDPGNYEFRLLSSSNPEDPGYMTLCWRDTVVNA